MSKLTSQQASVLREKIKQIEAQTDGEIVTVITPRSDHYFSICIAYAAILALLAPLLTSYWWSLGSNAVELFNIQALVFSVLCLLFAWWPIRRLLVSNTVMHERAKRMAHELFFMQKLHYKTQRNAIMLFVTEAERYVEVLVDKGISEKVDQQVWQGIIDEFITLVRAGKTAEGYEQAIDKCGALLIEHFPLSDQSKDELPNHLIEWEW